MNVNKMIDYLVDCTMATISNMRDIPCIILLLSFILVAFFNYQKSMEIESLENEIMILQNKIEVQREIKNDVHHILPHLRHQIIEIETEYTAREVIWTLANALKEKGVCVEIH